MCEVVEKIKNKGKIEAYFDEGRNAEEIAQKISISVEAVEAIIEDLGLKK